MKGTFHTMRYVAPLSKNEIKNLMNIKTYDSSARARDRAHAVILSDEGYRMNDIADILGVGRDTVSSWLDAWEKSSYEGLHDKPRSGRPSTLTEEEKKIAEKLTEENPRSPKKVIQLLYDMTGKTISLRTFRRLAGKADLIWKRVRKTVKPKRDEEEFEKAKKEIAELKEQQKKGDIDIFFFDESGFDLRPEVPYARQRKGKTTEIPSFRSSRINVVGFFNTENNDFHCLTFKCSVDSEIVIACFDDFSDRIDKKTVVILDRASFHTSGDILEHIENWEKKGLFLKHLPPYSPELNAIEILWRFIRHYWLPFSAYVSFVALREELEKVLRGIGSEYVINFS